MIKIAHYSCDGFKVVLFHGISTFVGFFSYQNHPRRRTALLLFNRIAERVNNFPKGICPKVNVIAQLAFELVCYDSAVHRFNNYTTGTPLLRVSVNVHR